MKLFNEKFEMAVCDGAILSKERPVNQYERMIVKVLGGIKEKPLMLWSSSECLINGWGRFDIICKGIPVFALLPPCLASAHIAVINQARMNCFLTKNKTSSVSRAKGVVMLRDILFISSS